MKELEPIMIEGFMEGKRTFGDLFAYRCRIDEKIDGAIIIPVRTHHGTEIIEIIAPCNLQRTLAKRPDGKVSIAVL